MSPKMRGATLLLLSYLVCLTTGDYTNEDITITFAEPIDFANQLLYDLDQQIQLLIKGQSVGPDGTNLETGVELSGKNAPPPPPTRRSTTTRRPTTLRPSTTRRSIIARPAAPTKKPDDSHVGNLLTNLSELDKRLQGTFQDLQTRRRYVLGAMIRQMQSTVRRIRSNVSRMQLQLNNIETVATQMPLIRPSLQSNSTANSVETAASILTANKEIIEQIEERINTVSKKINDIVLRLNASLNPSNAQLGEGQPINPIMTLNSIIQNTNPNNQEMLVKNPRIMH